MAYALLFLKARTQFILGPSSKYRLIVYVFFLSIILASLRLEI